MTPHYPSPSDDPYFQRCANCGATRQTSGFAVSRWEIKGRAAPECRGRER